jgi:hypothetical protein
MPRWSRRLRPRRNVVFSLEVDYSSMQKELGRSFSLHGRGDDSAGSKLEADLRNIIERELPRELSALFDIDVETKVLETKYTSLTIFFGALIATYPLISNYHDFIESVHLIKKHCALLVEALISSKYDDSFTESVDVYYPTMPDPTDHRYRWMDMFEHPGGEEAFAAAAFMQRPAAPRGRDLSSTDPWFRLTSSSRQRRSSNRLQDLRQPLYGRRHDDAKNDQGRPYKGGRK